MDWWGVYLEDIWMLYQDLSFFQNRWNPRLLFTENLPPSGNKFSGPYGIGFPSKENRIQAELSRVEVH